jgi:hypothetical protein
MRENASVTIGFVKGTVAAMIRAEDSTAFHASSGTVATEEPSVKEREKRKKWVFTCGVASFDERGDGRYFVDGNDARGYSKSE